MLFRSQELLNANSNIFFCQLSYTVEYTVHSHVTLGHLGLSQVWMPPMLSEGILQFEHWCIWRKPGKPVMESLQVCEWEWVLGLHSYTSSCFDLVALGFLYCTCNKVKKKINIKIRSTLTFLRIITLHLYIYKHSRINVHATSQQNNHNWSNVLRKN